MLGISCDSLPAHRAFSSSLGNITYPLLSDFHPHGEMCKSYGLWNGERGAPRRAVIIVDKEGIIQFFQGIRGGDPSRTPGTSWRKWKSWRDRVANVRQVTTAAVRSVGLPLHVFHPTAMICQGFPSVMQAFGDSGRRCWTSLGSPWSGGSPTPSLAARRRWR